MKSCVWLVFIGVSFTFGHADSLVFSQTIQSPATPVKGESPQVKGESRPELLAVTSIAADATDLSGLDGFTEEGLRYSRFGGISAATFSGQASTYFVLGDRGPGDGEVDWPCRFHKINVRYAAPNLEVSVVETKLLHDKENRNFSGLASYFEPNSKSAGRLDAEGISVTANGRIFISDEYGPKCLEIDSAGQVLREFNVPEKFSVKHPAATKAEENSMNAVGRVSNRGFESIAVESIDPNRPQELKALFALQSPLIQDSEKAANGWLVGKNLRLLEMDLQTGKTREYVYLLNSPTSAISEVLALGNHQYLAIERDDLPGSKAVQKWITKFDLSDATDVSNIDSLKGELSSEIQPVKKSIFIDLLDPKYKLAGETMPAKLEGLAHGPQLPNGHQSLLVVTDNDFEDLPTYFYLFEL